jgi:hypothetical protein
MKLDESVDEFGVPLAEARYIPNSAEDARDRLERSRSEASRALDSLRELHQTMAPDNQRMNSEIRSAIMATIQVEKVLITAIHRTENLIHRVRKTSAMTATEPEISSESVKKKSLNRK